MKERMPCVCDPALTGCHCDKVHLKDCKVKEQRDADQKWHEDKMAAEREKWAGWLDEINEKPLDYETKYQKIRNLVKRLEGGK